MLNYLRSLYLPVFLIAVTISINGCGKSQEKILTDATDDWCNCSAEPARFLAHIDSLDHDSRMKAMKDVNNVVTEMGDCLAKSKALKELDAIKAASSRTEALQIEALYLEMRNLKCPEAVRWIQK